MSASSREAQAAANVLIKRYDDMIKAEKKEKARRLAAAAPAVPRPPQRTDPAEAEADDQALAQLYMDQIKLERAQNQKKLAAANANAVAATRQQEESAYKRKSTSTPATPVTEARADQKKPKRVNAIEENATEATVTMIAEVNVALATSSTLSVQSL